MVDMGGQCAVEAPWNDLSPAAICGQCDRLMIRQACGWSRMGKWFCGTCQDSSNREQALQTLCPLCTSAVCKATGASAPEAEEALLRDAENRARERDDYEEDSRAMLGSLGIKRK